MLNDRLQSAFLRLFTGYEPCPFLSAPSDAFRSQLPHLNANSVLTFLPFTLVQAAGRLSCLAYSSRSAANARLILGLSDW